MKKKLKIVLKSILVFLLLVSILPFAIFGISSGISFYALVVKGITTPNPPKPEITYGEFPFTLVYEINGEEKVVEDTLICEYDGVEWAGDFVIWYYKWKCSLKSGNDNDRITLLKVDEDTEIYYRVSGWNMENPAALYTDYFSKSAWRVEIYPDYEVSGYTVSEEELLDTYGITIVSWEICASEEGVFK